jgi:uncharacterized protein (TIGR02145 family)
MRTLIKFVSIFMIFFLMIITCKKPEKFTDLEITDLTVVENSVKISGKITSLSGNQISDFGVCYGTKDNPVATDTVLRLGTPKVGVFTTEIKDLKRNKTYYFRAFIKEGDKYVYDDLRSAVIVAIAPVVSAVAASDINETSATLNGSVNAKGSNTMVSFEFGLTTDYGNTASSSQNIVSGSTDTYVNAILGSLTPNTTYHFRVKAVNAGGTVYSGDLAFMTNANVVAPLVTTYAATEVTNTSAVLNGSVNANASSTAVTFEYGTTYMYGSAANATPGTAEGITPVNVTMALTGLIPGQLYHFRVKAVSAGGTTYGEDNTFITTQPPAATTQYATAIAQTAARLNGLVNANGSPTDISFEYGTSDQYGSSVAGVPASSSGTENTASKADITELTANTTYHYRVKAISAGGITTGEDKIFTTAPLGVVIPTIYTKGVTAITETTATSGGNITSDGGAALTATGVCWSTAHNPTTADFKTSDGTATGIFASSITGLTHSTTYYVRAFATNTAGTAYGEEVTFTTLIPDPVKPTVITLAATLITNISAATGGNVTSDGGAEITARGVCLNTTGNPSIADQKTSEIAGMGYYISNLTGLAPGIQYYVKAYSTNSVGTSYGDEITFTTLSVEPVVPTLTTYDISEITSTTASGGGNITSNGGSEVISRGICYYTSPGPTLENYKTINSSGSGSFISPFSSLEPNTLYHVRAYATNIAGTAYGNEVSFTTLAPDPVLPTVTTSIITGITPISASGGGEVTDDGGAAITVKGVCWSISEDPTTSAFKTDDGPGAGIFISSLTGLATGTIYYVRAFATNSAGTAYGEQFSFTTSDPEVEFVSLTTIEPSDITSTTAITGGNISDDGGGAITARGVCYGTSINPTISGLKTDEGPGVGPFESYISALNSNTIYYVRAYATNSAGTAYGGQFTFTTLMPDPVIPTVTTATIVSFTHEAASGGGNVTNDGYASITSKGVCWSTSSNPTIADPKTNEGAGAGAFSSSITGLDPVTKYYVRAYATNSVGTSYGDDVTFTSSDLPYVIPTLTTTTASSITYNSAVTGGSISSDGGAPITSRGVCYSTSTNPTTADNLTSDGSGTGVFISNLTSLSASTIYYARAYATNDAGTAYGNQISFTTLVQVGYPIISTSAVTGLGSTTATSGGYNIDASGGTISARGVCWSTTINPTIANNKTSDGTGTIAFSSSLSGLTPCTLYHVRAYATNAIGTTYGADIPFTTGSVLPSITTTTASSVTSTTASTGGNITGNCTAGVTARGVCWGTAANPTVALTTKTTNGTGGGSYTSSITGLTPCTVYYVRAYATNSSGTVYGNEISFTTSTVLPTINTTVISAITSSTASTGGTITGNCTAGVTARGVCWSTTAHPTVALATKTSNGTAGGSYTSSITGLTPCTVYYVRAYATNSAGTVYGNEIAFTTSTVLPTIATTSISAVTSSTASSGGSVTGSCTAGVTARGVCWSTSVNPTTANSKTTNGTGGGTYPSNITGLTRATTYYVRAYATNSAGTVYGNQVSFTTLPSIPSVTSSSISIISATATSAGGNVTNDGGASVTSRGVCWNTSINPTTSNSIATSGSGTGSFSTSVFGLVAGTTYYIRAYATNSAGTGYGSNIMITVPATLTDASGNTYNTVSIYGQVWMQQNLRTSKYEDGTNLILNSDTAYTPTYYYHTYNNSSSNGTTYGFMYNGYCVGSPKDVCPTGWHVPTITEWSTLATNLGGSSAAGAKLNDIAINKLTMTYAYWNSAMSGHDNSSRFYARGGGYYFDTYAGLKNSTILWTSTSKRYVRIDYNSAVITGISSSLTGNDECAFYIRCKKD